MSHEQTGKQTPEKGTESQNSHDKPLAGASITKVADKTKHEHAKKLDTDANGQTGATDGTFKISLTDYRKEFSKYYVTSHDG